ncbi:ABC transporter ATP-binding protein [Parabacteroides sp. PF5-6]|uniref:ABC transporter ATP-binding protein n=1 Tax=Parabacteroides sp. PF5-6 TaxID=1742403 RepID=UPI002404EFC5|nr:ABC transporter ATP-binding protein [Parabacteroides sp. PF5-6]MDF9831410.1 ABC-2 type transport system ATP-binding protein [Parabacteroides sp. PF5-6]
MIQLKDVNFAYKSNKPVLRNITLEMGPGRIYGLLGKNGEGKTTLLNILCGQLFPQSGQCRVLDAEPKKRAVDFLQQLFILPEEVKLPDVTANAYMEMYRPFYPGFRQDLADLCFKEFEIEGDKRIAKMSLGQKKKVALALALSVQAPLLLLDEPTNGLDIPSKVVFRRLVSSCLNENQTVIISTHQVRDLESLIDSVLILENCRILLNADLGKVAEKLFFRLVSAEEKVLYAETSPVGLMGVGENVGGEETPVSLELLFQAVTRNPKEIKQLFNV